MFRDSIQNIAFWQFDDSSAILNSKFNLTNFVLFLTKNLKKEDYLDLINTYRDEFNVVLELGWSPPDNLKNLTPFERQFFKDLNKQNLYKSYLIHNCHIKEFSLKLRLKC